MIYNFDSNRFHVKTIRFRFSDSIHLFTGLPDRKIIEGGPPESIAEAFQEMFAAKIAKMKLACAQARAQMGWPARPK